MVKLLDDFHYGIMIFISHTLVISIIFIGFFIGIWNLNLEMVYRILIIGFSIPTMFDIIKFNIWTRYLLWKQSLNNFKDYSKELKKV